MQWTDRVSDGGVESEDALEQAGGSSTPQATPTAITHAEPKCTVCGYVGQFKKPPLIYPRDLLISIVLFFLFGAGLIWFTISVLQKKQPSCPHCGSRGHLTYVY